MDEQRARGVMKVIGERVGGSALLWRGAEVTGSDIDLVVFPEGQYDFELLLGDLGLAKTDGERLWRSREGDVAVDPLWAAEWPDWYPPLDGVRARAARHPGLPPVAAPEDRLLIYAADAVRGKQVAKLAAKAQALIGDDGVRHRMLVIADSLGERALAQLIAEPERFLGDTRRGSLSYRRALAIGARSRLARRALVARAVETALRRLSRRRRRGLLITLSGMDGAGKSSASLAIQRRLIDAGLNARIEWHRLGEDEKKLDRIGRPIKRLLRRSVTIADPIASRAPTETTIQQDPRVAGGRPSLLARIWVLVVTSVTLRSHWQTNRLRKGAHHVVCDRWVCDSLVDLEVRYGRHRLASWLLQRAVRPPDLALFLEIDAETAALRKPEDQAMSILERMEALYAAAVDSFGVVRIDAKRPHEDVLAEVLARVEPLIEGRR
jgi:thymidylate kinase